MTRKDQSQPAVPSVELEHVDAALDRFRTIGRATSSALLSRIAFAAASFVAALEADGRNSLLRPSVVIAGAALLALVLALGLIVTVRAKELRARAEARRDLLFERAHADFREAAALLHGVAPEEIERGTRALLDLARRTDRLDGAAARRRIEIERATRDFKFLLAAAAILAGGLVSTAVAVLAAKSTFSAVTTVAAAAAVVGPSAALRFAAERISRVHALIRDGLSELRAAVAPDGPLLDTIVRQARGLQELRERIYVR